MPNPSVRASGSGSAQSSTVSPTKPTGTASGDILYLWVTYQIDTDTISTPSGFTLTHSFTTQGFHGSLFRRLCNGTGADTPPSLTISSSQKHAWVSVAVKDCASTDDVTSYAEGSSSTAIAASVTTTVANDLLLCFFGGDNSSSGACTFTAPSGMTELEDVSPSSGYAGCALYSQAIASAGATGTRSAPCNRNGGWAAAAIAFKPGTTVVSKTIDVRWDLNAGISKSIDLRWDLLAPVSKSIDVRWDLLAAVSKPIDIRWDFVSVVTKTLDARWDILSVSTKTFDFRWNILSAFSKTSDLRWNILAAVSKVSDIRWDQAGILSKNIDIRWDMGSFIVAKTLDVQWGVAAVRSPTVRSSTSGIGSGDTLVPTMPAGLVAGDILYIQVVNVQDSRTQTTPAGFDLIREVVHSGTGPSGVGYRARIYGRLCDGTATDTPTILFLAGFYVWSYVCVAVKDGAYPQYAISQAESFTMNTSVTSAQLATQAYNDLILLFVNADTNNTGAVNMSPPSGMTELRDTGSPGNIVDSQVYPVPGLTGTKSGTLTQTASWAAIMLGISGGASPALDFRWAVEQTISKSLDARWSVSQAVSKSLDAQWVVSQAVSKSLDVRWDMISSVVAKTLDARWDIRAAVSKALDARWQVTTSVTLSISLQWAISLDPVVRSFYAYTGSGTYGITRPAGTIAGDILYLWVASAAAIPTPVGFTLFHSDSVGVLRVAMFRRIADGTSGDDVPMTPWIGQTSFVFMAVMNAFLTEDDTAYSTGTGTSVVANGVGTTHVNNLLLVFMATDVADGAANFSTPAGMTEVTDGFDVAADKQTIVSPVGTTGTRTSTIPNSNPWATATISLRNNAIVVSKSIDVRWSIPFATVSKTIDIRWFIPAFSSKTLDVRWASYGTIANGISLLWNVSGALSLATHVPPQTEVEVRLVDRYGTLITYLPSASVDNATWELCAEGDASITVDAFGIGVSKIELWDTEVQIWWNGVLRWWGVPWSCGGNARGGLSFQCKGVISLLYKRFIDRMSLIYGDASVPTLVEQFSIGQALVDYAQNESVQGHRDLNIDAAAYAPSGVGRTAQYKLSEHKNILDLLKEFPTMYNGFEWDVDILGSGQRLWHPYYPKKGQLRTEFTMQFDEGGSRNMVGFEYSEDFFGGTTDAMTTGGSVSGIKIEDRYEDLTASADHGVMQNVISVGSTLDHGTLVDRARKEVEINKNPVIMAGIKSARTTDIDMFGNVTTGDWIPIRIDYGRMQVNAKERIQVIKWNSDDTLDLTFSEVVA